MADPVLLVGAGLGTTVAGLWSRCASRIEHADVFGIDLPGHGGTAPATRVVTMQSLADVVRARAEEFGDRPVWYAGVSLAGAVGLTLALDPGALRGVAVLAAASRIGEPPSWLERAETAEGMLRELTEVDARSYAACCAALASYDLQGRVADAKVPVLLGRGELDVVVSTDVWEHDASALPDVTTEVFAGCGHQPPAEDPTRVADVLTNWIHQGVS